jgi:PTS system nitrogen regulatory IIA component
MKVLDFLQIDSVSTDLKSQSKQDVITELCQLLKSNGHIADDQAVVTSLLEREKLGSTGIGQGIAIPHAKCAALNKIVAALGVSKKGIDFDSLDGEPVHVIFLLVAPPDSSGLHLKALARISRLLKDKFFRQALREAKTSDEIQKIIREEDEF